MEQLASMSAAETDMSALEAARSKSVVSYHVPSSFVSDTSPPAIYIEEARNLLAARGTTGLRVWDAGLHLAYFLATDGVGLVKDKNVLELGAGPGLVSILCAGPLEAAGAIATDGDAQVVGGIERNLSLNASLLPRKNVRAEELDWSNDGALPDILLHRGSLLPLDLIVGADITYATESHEPLAHMVAALQNLYPSVDILISTVIRNQDTYDSFINTCATKGIRTSVVGFDCPPFDLQRGFFHQTYPPMPILRLTQDLEYVENP